MGIIKDMLPTHQVSYFLYANEYSKCLLEDYIKEKKPINYTLINIGKGPGITSAYCKPSASGFKLVQSAANLNKILQKQLSQDKKIYVVIPCTNHIMPGMFLSLAKKFPDNIYVDHVAEGTLNYCKRTINYAEFNVPVYYRLVTARVIKKLLSLAFNFPYLLSFKDNVDVVFNSSSMICRSSEGLVTNAEHLLIVESAETANEKKNRKVNSRKSLLIVGSHIIESYLGGNKKKYLSRLQPLSKKLMELPIPFDEVDVFYLPHPRAKEGGGLELQYVYSELKPEVLDFSNGAKRYVLEENPDYIICLAGSTLFIEIKSCNFQGSIIAWGFDELIDLGCRQAALLRDVHVKLDTAIC